MAPTVAIVEPDRDMAASLEEVVTLARCMAVKMTDFEELTDLPHPPAALIVRIATNLPQASHRGLAQLAIAGRPKILALTSTDADVEEAERLRCDIVLRQPHQIRALYDALAEVAATIGNNLMAGDD